MDYYWDRLGEPMSRDDYLDKMGSEMYKRVALDTFPDGTFVSTVWLGLDHSLGGLSRVLWETMVFQLPGQSSDDWGLQYRYTTESAARRGHRVVVDAIAAGASYKDLEQLELEV